MNCPLGIVFGLFQVLTAVQFEDEFLLDADKIGNVTVNRMLPAEVDAQYLGAAYLVYLGLKRILRPETPPTEAGLEKQSLGRIFSQGVAVAILNPKTALFFLAFLPQFVDPAQGNVAWQLFSLGSIFVAMAVFTDGLYALLAGSAGQVLKKTPAFLKADRYLVGGIYVGLGILAAVSGANH